MTQTQATALLFVPAIEPVLPLWRDVLGFAITAEVPHGGVRGFVILTRDDATVMLQTHESADSDDAALGAAAAGARGMVYLRVPDLAAVQARLGGEVEVLVPLRTTFYGAREIFLRDPAGNIIAVSELAES